MTLDAAALGWDLPLPDEDTERSPVTGWTRTHWATVADNLLLAARRYASDGGAHLDLPGRPSRSGVLSDGLEGWARTFPLAAMRVRGEAGADPHGHLDFYRRGVVAGTRHTLDSERTAESWQDIRSASAAGQPMVESASVAIGLHLTRPWLWDTLTAREQDGVEGWLRGALTHDPAPNNWYLFPMMVAGFLEDVGRGDAATAAAIDHALALLETWYDGEGWYRDGDGRAYDHYIGWIMHFYPVLYAWLRGDEPLLSRFADRLEEFLGSFLPTFDANGAPLHQGRSLTYRTAALAAPAMASVVGRHPWPAGQARALTSRTLRYFLERGSVERGLFSLGWHGPHDATLQSYSGPGSPYWAVHGFAALLLGEADPYWTETEIAPPTSTGTRHIAAVGWLIQSTDDGLVRVHNHGSDHMHPGADEGGDPDPLYARLAYSTRTGPTPVTNVADNSVEIEHEGRVSVRRRIHPLGTGPGWAASAWQPRFPGVAGFVPGPRRGAGTILPGAWIDVLTLADGADEVRVVRLRGLRPGHRVRLSGWAMAGEEPGDLTTALQPSAVEIRTTDLTSVLTGLAGLGEAHVLRAPAGTAYGRWALVPAVTGTWEGSLLVAHARLAGGSSEAAVPTAEVDGTTARITLSRGVRTVDWSAERPTVAG